jgi:DNA-binding XRE family transcriptional regulator
MGKLVACNLRKIRSRLNLPQWKLALFTDIPASTLSLYEHGYPPNKKVMQRLAQFCGVTTSEIWPNKEKQDIKTNHNS